MDDLELDPGDVADVAVDLAGVGPAGYLLEIGGGSRLIRASITTAQAVAGTANARAINTAAMRSGVTRPPYADSVLTRKGDLKPARLAVT